jgi:hypothetical protein
LGIGEIMDYIVTSNKKVCGKVKDERLTEKELTDAGGNIEFLIAAGHIAPANKVVEYKKEEPKKEEVQVLEEETEAFVFNNEYNEGDK